MRSTEKIHSDIKFKKGKKLRVMSVLTIINTAETPSILSVPSTDYKQSHR